MNFAQNQRININIALHRHMAVVTHKHPIMQRTVTSNIYVHQTRGRLKTENSHV